MPRRKIPEAVRQRIRDRAGSFCEYCHVSEVWQYVRFTVDHIVPVSLGGSDAWDNLCLACFHCNRRKSRNIRGNDPASGDDAPLFHPRKDAWNDHFAWSSDMVRMVGLSPVGRATVELLELNRERIVRIRMADLEIGRHPPDQDNVQK